MLSTELQLQQGSDLSKRLDEDVCLVSSHQSEDGFGLNSNVAFLFNPVVMVTTRVTYVEQVPTFVSVL